jgi:hypothetical protein
MNGAAAKDLERTSYADPAAALLLHACRRWMGVFQRSVAWANQLQNRSQYALPVQEDGYVPVICGMGRTVFKDLERTWEAVRHAQRPRVHMVLATSEIHMKHKLHMTRDQVGCPLRFDIINILLV